ncbi:MAG: hypothetical protein BGO69_14700 [Bacteroidetes bacterium 46-16]|nr:MAG: hypothetical protein BGO69_14700 [Bacteroidetes bacterium 46-16]
MSMGRNKETQAIKRQAAIDLTEHYLSAMGYDWRLIKVRGIEKMLIEKYTFFKELTPQYDEGAEAMIAQEVTIGLYCDAISECVQYVEDLFALIRASENPDYFIKNIITYQAGQVTSKIKTFVSNKESIETAFHLPKGITFSLQEDTENYANGIVEMQNLCNDIIKFYQEYEYFYVQYKHGLTIPFRPFGNSYSVEQVSQEKCGELVPFIAAYDNFNLKASSQRGTFSTNHGVMMPGFSENVQAVLTTLHDENNYLRFVFPPNPDLHISQLVIVAKKINLCIRTFVYNFYHKLKDNPNSIASQIPTDFNKNLVLSFTYNHTE